MLSQSASRVSTFFLLSVMAGILSLPMTSAAALAFELGNFGKSGQPFAFGRFYQYDPRGAKWDNDFPYRVSSDEFDPNQSIQDGFTRYYRKPQHQPRTPYPRYNSVKLYRDSTGGIPPDRSPRQAPLGPAYGLSHAAGVTEGSRVE